MNVLVTGGAGFIGSHTCEALLARGESVICIDSFNDYYDPKQKELNIKECTKNSKFKLYREDIRNLDKLKQIFKENEIDKIIHLAAYAGVRYSIQNPLLYADVNINGTMNLLDLAKSYKIQNFVFASSSSVYGNNKKVPFSETDNVDFPISPYAATKKSCELMCHTYHKLYDLNVTCLRFFTVYGPRGRPDMAPYKFTKIIDEGKELPMFGDGTTKRDYTYVSDILNGILAALDKDLEFEIINIGNSSTIELREFITVIEKLLDKKANIKKKPMQPGDVNNTFADVSKAKELLGYSPKISVEEGMKKFVSWYKKNKI